MPKSHLDYERSAEEIIWACQSSGHVRYVFKHNDNLHRNRDLLALFGEHEVLRISELTPRMQQMHARDGYSEAFEAKRAGELIRWGMDRGVLAAETPDQQAGWRLFDLAWRLLDREMQYLLVGPATKQREIRYRGIKDQVELVEATRLANREFNRRDRARRKNAQRIRDAMERNLERLSMIAPDRLLTENFARFRIDETTTFMQARSLILDAAGDEDAEGLLNTIWALHATHKMTEVPAPAAPAIDEPPADDADAMGDIQF